MSFNDGYDDDFYHEPSEFEMKMEELKESLLTSVKKDFLDEIERLRSENNELQKVKKEMESIKTAYRNKERELEFERKDLEHKVRRERLRTLMQDFEIISYRARSKRVQGEKCDKCDEKRRIPYLTPSGKQQHEDCICSIGKLVYYPTEYKCSSFRIDRDGKKMNMWYVPYNEEPDSSYISSTYAEGFINKPVTNYEELNTYGTFFASKDECQKYCDWLTRKEEVKALEGKKRG